MRPKAIGAEIDWRRKAVAVQPVAFSNYGSVSVSKRSLELYLFHLPTSLASSLSILAVILEAKLEDAAERTH